MNITAIQTFLAVTRLGNLNRASEQLNVTQSAVTSRLDALELALGARLLNRARSGATLTKAGYAFLDQAELIVRTWEASRTRASLPEGITRMFSLVCDPALWSSVGAPWVDTLRETQQGTAFDIWSGGAADARRWLQSGMSDAALLSEPLTGTDFAHRPFARETLIQVATEARGTVDWDPGYIFVDYGPVFRNLHARTWPGDHTAQVSFSNPEWALSHLLRQGGSAYLPQPMVADHLRRKRLFAVEGSPEFERHCHLSWRKAVEPDFPWLA